MSGHQIKQIIGLLLGALVITGCNGPDPSGKSEIDISRIENYQSDGNPVEWADVEFYRLWADPLGRYAEPSDLEAGMKAGWNNEALVLLFEVTDDSNISDTLNPWNGDAIEIFLAPSRISGDILQFSIVPSSEKDFIRITGLNRVDSNFIFSGKIESVTSGSGNKRITEVKIGFRKPANPVVSKSYNHVRSFALQAYVDDADSFGTGKNILVWYPVGQSYNSSSSMFMVNLTEENHTKLNGSSRLVITDNEKLDLYVFGALNGDQIRIYRNGDFIKNFKSTNASSYLPDSFDISSLGINLETDSVFISLNGETLCLHELFLAPRLYEKTTEKRFEREIRNFLLRDRQSFPPENGTLFIGSSSIVRWETLKKDFPELNIIHRGFGGSNSAEALMYMDQIALPYKPSKIVYYEGDNDVPQGLSADEISQNVKLFIDKVAMVHPETKIYVLSPKPSINRMHLWDNYLQTHASLRKLAVEYENVIYVDVSTPMFLSNGKLNHSLFIEDGIHMNDDGYRIWTNVLRKELGL